jgi:very-short-patch-repair endonuclease
VRARNEQGGYVKINLIGWDNWKNEFMRPEHYTITDKYIERAMSQSGGSRWPIMRRALFNAHDYTGPYDFASNVNRHKFYDSLQPPLTGRNVRGIDEADCVLCYLSDETEGPLEFIDFGYAWAKNKRLYLVCGPVWTERLRGLKTGEGEILSRCVKSAFDIKHPVLINAVFQNMLLSSGDYFDSPVEKMFWNAALLESSLSFIPQYPVGPYYVDFAIHEKRIAIEIDGHDFHKTKEQRTRDAQRDRTFTERGWTVLRFTGTEVFTNVKKCLGQVVNIAESQEQRRQTLH